MSYLKRELRIQKIIEGIIEGRTYEETAKDCGVSSKTIQRDRRSIEFHAFVKPLFDQQLEAIFNASDKDALRYRDSILRALLPQKIESKVEAKGELKFILEAWRPEREKSED